MKALIKIPGQLAALTNPGAQVYFRPNNENGYFPLGNILSLKQNTKVQTLEHYASKAGFKQMNAKIATQSDFSYEVTLDEQFGKNIEFLCLSQEGVASNQTTGTWAGTGNGVLSITANEVGRSYMLNAGNGKPALGATVTAVSGGTSSTAFASSDYSVDKSTGMITLLNIPVAAAADTTIKITGTFPTINQVDYTTMAKLLFEGDFIIGLADQNSTVARRVIMFHGSAIVGDFGEMKPDAFNEFKLDITALAAPTVSEIAVV